MSPNQDLSGGNANPRLNGKLGFREVGNDAQASADRALGVIFVKLRYAEDGDDRIAYVLLYGAAVRFDSASADLVVRLQDFCYFFWIKSLA